MTRFRALSFFAAVALAVVLAGGFAAAAPSSDASSDLYTARTIVTGTDMRERPLGFARCFRDVIVKLTGDFALAEDERLSGDDPGAEAMAEDYVYLDRMSDVPMHDEQGTRDRPFDLIVRFSPAKIDAVLARIGVPAWAGPRPPLVMLVTISRGDATYPLTADGLPDDRLREALEDAAWRYGMRVVLIPEATIKAASSVDAVPLPPIPGAIALHGTLKWTPSAYGWVGAWRLNVNGTEHTWGVSGVSFDEAFRDAVRGAARILAGRA